LKILFIHDESDNVAVALRDLAPGEILEIEIGSKTEKIEVKEPIPFGHKIAIRDIEKGSNIIKYGEVIGIATDKIVKGSHVHVHNIRSLRY